MSIVIAFLVALGLGSLGLDSYTGGGGPHTVPPAYVGGGGPGVVYTGGGSPG
jgi:hypothetical protein